MPTDRIFLSYHPHDEDVVSRIESDLAKRGIPTFLPPRDVRPGESKHWTTKKQITVSQHMVAGISPAYLAAIDCRTQLFLARASGVQVLPIIAGEFPGERSPRDSLMEAGRKHTYAVKGLEEVHIADFTGHYPAWGAGSYETNFEHLVEAIRPVDRPIPLSSALCYVSYYASDLSFARRLVRDLEAVRACVWFDRLSIKLGASWRAAMYEGMRQAQRLVVCLSPRAAASEHVNHEVLLALQRELPILPLVPEAWAAGEGRRELEDALVNSREMHSLLDLQWLTAIEGYERMFDQLKEALELAQPAPKRNGIFLSYRRIDSQATTGRIREHLVKRYGPENVFTDVGTIPPGVDFSAEYRNWIQQRAAVMLVVIGKTWSSVLDAGAANGLPRIQTDGDHVRTEIAMALNTPGVRVMPVLVDQGTVPRESELPPDLHALSTLNGLQVRHDPDFAHDIDVLLDAIKDLVRIE